MTSAALEIYVSVIVKKRIEKELDYVLNTTVCNLIKEITYSDDFKNVLEKIVIDKLNHTEMLYGLEESLVKLNPRYTKRKRNKRPVQRTLKSILGIDPNNNFLTRRASSAKKYLRMDSEGRRKYMNENRKKRIERRRNFENKKNEETPNMFGSVMDRTRGQSLLNANELMNNLGMSGLDIRGGDMGVRRSLGALKDGAKRGLDALKDGAKSRIDAAAKTTTSSLGALKDGTISGIGTAAKTTTSGLGAVKDGAKKFAKDQLIKYNESFNEDGVDTSDIEEKSRLFVDDYIKYLKDPTVERASELKEKLGNIGATIGSVTGISDIPTLPIYEGRRATIDDTNLDINQAAQKVTTNFSSDFGRTIEENVNTDKIKKLIEKKNIQNIIKSSFERYMKELLDPLLMRNLLLKNLSNTSIKLLDESREKNPALASTYEEIFQKKNLLKNCTRIGYRNKTIRSPK